MAGQVPDGALSFTIDYVLRYEDAESEHQFYGFVFTTPARAEGDTTPIGADSVTKWVDITALKEQTEEAKSRGETLNLYSVELLPPLSGRLTYDESLGRYLVTQESGPVTGQGAVIDAETITMVATAILDDGTSHK